MDERRIPNNLNEKYLEERANLYKLLWTLEDAQKALASGNVASYSLGNRSVSYQNIDQIKQLISDTESRIDEIEALLSHRAPRCVMTNTYLDPAIIVPRRL